MPHAGSPSRASWASLGPALADVVDTVLAPLALLSTDFRFVAVNRAYCAVVGRSPEEVLGRVVFEAFPESGSAARPDAPGLRQSLELVLSTGRPHSMSLLRYDVAVSEGGPLVERYWHVSNTPILDDEGEPWLIVNHPEEVTEFIDERMRLEAIGTGDVDETVPSSRLQAVDNAFTAAIARLQNLNDLASALVGATTADAIGTALLTDGLAMVGAIGGSFVTVDHDRFTIMDHRGVDETTADRWRSFQVRPGVEPFSDSLGDGTPRFFDSRTAMLEEYPDLAGDLRAEDHRAWAVLPLHVGDNVVGAIGLIYADESPFTAPLRLVLYTLANLATQASARARLVEEQATVMRSVELAFQPSLDPIDGVEVSELYRPASSSTNAGGDWYDIIEVNDRCTLIAIGDVANHGPVAVGEMARTRATVHALALQGLAPDEIATMVDRVLARVAAMFTTSVIAILDTSTRTFTWTNAGHPHPILRSADGTARLVPPTHGAPLGSGLDESYEASSVVLEPGDTLVLYTDGLVERPDEDIDAGFGRLRRAVEDVEPSPSLATELFDRLVGTGQHADDVAVLTLRFS